MKKYRDQILRSDNLRERQNGIYYATIGVGALSFIVLRKGYIRYTLRNGLLTYIVGSYVVCPENINPF